MTVAARATEWLRWYTPVAGRAFRLVCLPPAGGAASFYKTWTSHVPADVGFAAMQYPGRENRLSEPPLEDMRQLAEGAAAALRDFCGGPLALFGHSLGAAVAYEVALRLPPVSVLFVSGCAPPHVHAARAKKRWDDESIVDDLKRLGGPNGLVLEQAALRSLILPAIRADYRLTEDYVPIADARLSCPVVAFHGAHDGEVTVDDMRQWSEVSTGSFELQTFEGDHFFPLQQGRDVVTEILRRTAPLRGRPALRSDGDTRA
jgi:pyochelin biosynthetic protein PchC